MTKAEKLETKEAELKAQLHPRVRGVNHKKRLILTAQLLKEMGYPDQDVAFRAATGFHLVGDLKRVPVFEDRPDEEVVHGADPVWLARTARVSRKATIERVQQTVADDTLRSVYETTTDPRRARWPMDGPSAP